MNALVFLYKHVLQESPGDSINAARAAARIRVPVVLTRDEAARVLALMSGVHRLIAQLLYGCGLRITECLRLRVPDLDFDRKALTATDNGTGRMPQFREALPRPKAAGELPTGLPERRGVDSCHRSSRPPLQHVCS